MKKKLLGKLTSGTGRGARFISMTVYQDIFTKYLDEIPFCGTLNLLLEEKDRETIEELFSNADKFDNLVNDGKPTGGIIVVSLHLSNNGNFINCVGVRPLLTTHSSDVLEIVYSKNIRELWNLKDGDHVYIYNGFS